MSVVLFLFVIYRVSTLHAGNVNKVLMDNDTAIYVAFPYSIYKNGSKFLSINNIIQDFCVSADTLMVLNRQIGTFDTYLDIYVRGIHTGHFGEGSGGKYLEKGDGFYLIGTDFWITLQSITGKTYTANIYNGHVFNGNMVAGYKGFSNDFVVLKPLFLGDSFKTDTLYYQSNVPFQRDFFQGDSTFYFIGFDGNVYYLIEAGDSFSLKRLYSEHDGDFYFGDMVKNKNGSIIYYLSTLTKTYVYTPGIGDSLVLLDSLRFAGVDFVGSGDTVYVKSLDGILYRISGEKVLPVFSYCYALSDFRFTSRGIYALSGGFTALIDIENPMGTKFYYIDSSLVKDFIYVDSVFVFISAGDSLFFREGSNNRLISDSVSPGMVVYGNYLYFIRNKDIVVFDMHRFVRVNSLSLADEKIFSIMLYRNNIYAVSVDSSGKTLHIRKADTFLDVTSHFQIDGGGTYISPLSPDFSGNSMFIPYIRQGINEYRIAVLDIDEGVFKGEFSGHGSIAGISAVSTDSVFILEEPYGLNDLRLCIVDFKDSAFYAGEFIGASSAKSSIFTCGDLLCVYTEGRFDIFIIPNVPLVSLSPFTILGNVIRGTPIVDVYSLLTTQKNVILEVYTVEGRKILSETARLQHGVNRVALNYGLKEGMFVLRIKESTSNQYVNFKFIYLR